MNTFKVYTPGEFESIGEGALINGALETARIRVLRQRPEILHLAIYEIDELDETIGVTDAWWLGNRFTFSVDELNDARGSARGK